MNIHRQQLPKLPRPRETRPQPQRVARDVMHRATCRQVFGNIRTQLRQRLGTGDHRCRAAKQLLINLGQQIRIVISLAAQHHAIEGLQMLLALFEGLDAAVEDDLQFREILLQLGGNVVAQGRDVPIFLR